SVLDEKRSHWVAKGPRGRRAEWDAEIIQEVENRSIAWRSLDGSYIENAGTVHFEPVEGGTMVRVELQYNPPGGLLGAAFAKLFREEPTDQINEDLNHLKL